MADDVSSYYETIAGGLLQMLPAEWKVARVIATFYPQSSEYDAEYIDMSDQPCSCQIADASCRAIRELRNIAEETGERTWGQFVFEIDPTGSFKAQYGYDNCDENGDTIFNAEEWHERQRQSRLRYGFSQ